jgi:fructose-specific phosphotransferase system IIC component
VGKTVAAVVGLAAAVAIAIVAPPLGGALATAIFGATATATAIATATAVVTIGLSLAVGFAFRALNVGVPSAKNTVGPPRTWRLP